MIDKSPMTDKLWEAALRFVFLIFCFCFFLCHNEIFQNMLRNKRETKPLHAKTSLEGEGDYRKKAPEQVSYFLVRHPRGGIKFLLPHHTGYLSRYWNFKFSLRGKVPTVSQQGFPSSRT